MLDIFDRYKIFDSIQIPESVRKCGAFIYQFYKWLFFAPFLVVTTVALGIPACLIGWFIDPNLASRLAAVTWAKLNAWATPVFVRVSGIEHVNRKQSYVIVCNHQSLYDIFILYGWLGIDFKWVMKKELQKVPVLGAACDAMGHIYIDRSDGARAVEELNRAKERIVDGISVLFFPEGTRSLTGALRPFKKGAFKMALDLGLPVLPVTIRGTRDILPANSIDLFPGQVQMIIHKPIDIGSYTEANIGLLMERARTNIEGAMDHP